MNKLFRKIAEYLFLLYVRFKTKEEVIDVSDFLSQTVTALVLAPERPEEFMLAVQHLNELQKLFPATQFYFTYNKVFSESVKSRGNLQQIPYEADQIHFYGLPKQALLEDISSRHFDIVIDLNQDFSLLAARLTHASDAKLRICLQNDKRDPVYNFQVQTGDSYTVNQKFECLIKYLSYFKSLPDDSPTGNLMHV